MSDDYPLFITNGSYASGTLALNLGKSWTCTKSFWCQKIRVGDNLEVPAFACRAVSCDGERGIVFEYCTVLTLHPPPYDPHDFGMRTYLAVSDTGEILDRGEAL
jgi:hypothetical protein